MPPNRAARTRLSDEQRALIAHDGPAVVDACAGAGKTTTLLAYATARPQQRILYLGYNRSVRQEALQRFRQAGCPHVEVHTIHSLAFRHMGVSRDRLAPAGSYTAADILRYLGLPHYDDERELLLAGHIARLFHHFLNSTARSPDELPYPPPALNEAAAVFAQQHLGTIRDATRQLWRKVQSAEIPWTHDAYLKLFALSEPQLAYDTILLDEAQDSNPVTLELLTRQHAHLVAVGDSQQAIYGFRYATNALERLDLPRFYLRQSWRFGPPVATLAENAVALKLPLGTYPKTFSITGCGPKAHAHPNGRTASGPPAVLARTNARLLATALTAITNGVRALFFEGGLTSYTFLQNGASLFDLWHLLRGQRTKIRSVFLQRFQSVQHFKDYLAATADRELKLLFDIVLAYRNRLPSVLRELKSREIGDKQRGELILSTLHKSKGMEYDTVLILDDFIDVSTIAKETDTDPPGHRIAELNEEVNMLYTAITRAARAVHFSRNPFAPPASLEVPS